MIAREGIREGEREEEREGDMLQGLSPPPPKPKMLATSLQVALCLGWLYADSLRDKYYLMGQIAFVGSKVQEERRVSCKRPCCMLEP